MATPNYSYEKRQKELAKKRKKEDKLKKKSEGKPDDEVHEDGTDVAPDSIDGTTQTPDSPGSSSLP